MSTHWMDNNDWKREAEYETIHETYKLQAHGEMIDEFYYMFYVLKCILEKVVVALFFNFLL